MTPVTLVDEQANEYIAEVAELDPCLATVLGLTGTEARLTDYSPDGFAARDHLNRRARGAIVGVEASSWGERVAAKMFRDHLDREIEAFEAGFVEAMFNPIDGPTRDLQLSIELLDQGSATPWPNVLARLRAMPDSLSGLTQTLREQRQAHRLAARRQVLLGAEQCDQAAAYLEELSRRCPEGRLAVDVERAAERAAGAFHSFASFCRGELAAFAPERDARGEDRYRLGARYFMGAELDLPETYAWGWNEISRIEAEIRAVAERIAPGDPLSVVLGKLDSDPAHSMAGVDRFRAWLQELADRAIADLDGVHFEIPMPLRRIECRIPPTAVGGIYYLPPSEDFGRPGQVWWTVTNEQIPTWTVPSTMYHEGVPGHHLQQGMAVCNSDGLNRLRRVASEWCYSGYMEGWGLYAERLMGELGYYSDPAHHLGMLTQQRWRAARVVLDIGLHLELEIPKGAGFHEGQRWTRQLGIEFLRDRGALFEERLVTYEIDRYLGRPGQAASYKLGERTWLEVREQAKRRDAAAFDLKAFHQAALDLGPMGLDSFRDVMAGLDNAGSASSARPT